MADIRGSACLLQIASSTGGTYTTLEGQTDTTFSGATQTVDTTAKDSGNWQSQLPVALDGTITATGNLRTSRPMYELVRTAWLDLSPIAARIIFDTGQTPQEGYEGLFRVLALGLSSPASGLTTYNLTLSPDEAGLAEI